MERNQLNVKQFTPRGVHAAISDAKNALVAPDEYANLAMDPFSRAVAVVYRELGEALRVANAVDFDDLLVLPVRLLAENPAELEKYRRKFRYLLVDEYQDTNRAQYQFVKLLAGGHGNLCVVGDDDQSIYGWRGADIRNILDFNKDFPEAHVVRLEENYRSTPEVLDLANVVISANKGRMGKTLRATHRSGERVTAARCLDERDEADFIVEELVARRAQSSSLTLRDIAILYRTNAQSRALEEALRKRALPYRIVGAVRFYDRREIRDLMSYLKLVANPADDEALRRAIAVPKRGLGEATIEQLSVAARAAGVPMLVAAVRPDLVGALRPAARAALAEFAALIARFRESAREAAVDELLREIVDGIRYAEYLRAEGPESADRLENVRELITGAAETVADEEGEVGLTPLDHFLQRAMLVSELDKLGPDADAVTLMTLHNAKGLEFPIVFISGLEDGLFPLAESVRRSRAPRGGASPLLRRHHPRRAKALSHPRRRAAPQRRVHAVQGVELSGRDPGGHARAADDDQGAQLRTFVHALARRRQPVGQLAPPRHRGHTAHGVSRRRRVSAECRRATSGHAGVATHELRRRRSIAGCRRHRRWCTGTTSEVRVRRHRGARGRRP
jgi:DNA helicase-2/ATP-dependent DNA helicase PcrA